MARKTLHRYRSQCEPLEARVLLSGSISGFVFDDLNTNGLRDVGEAGRQGIVVYLDGNNNQTLDAGETQTLSGADGAYGFGNLVAGTYTVRQSLPSGYTQTTPTATPGGGSTVIVEPDSVASGTNISTFFPGVTLRALGSAVINPAVVSLPATYPSTGTLTFGYDGTSAWRGTSNYLQVDFAQPVASVSLDFVARQHGMILPELLAFNASGQLIASNLFTGPTPRGVPVTLTTTAPQGQTIARVEAYWDRVGGTSRGAFDRLSYTTVAQPAGPGAHTVTLSDSQSVTARDFGNLPSTTPAPTLVDLLATSDTGVSNTDNLTRLNNTPGNTLQFLVSGTLAGATVQLLNGSTVIGSAVATGPSTTITTNGSTTLPNGPRTLTARQTAPLSLTSANSPALGVTIDTIAPIVTVDPLTTTDPTPPLSGTVDDASATVTINVNSSDYAVINHGNGTWSLADDLLPALQPGTYDVVVTASDLAGNAAVDATTNELVIEALTVGVITGSVFDDPNTNGVFDTGDAYLAGITVWIDANDNALLDAGETQALTAANGSYTFTDLDSGSYTVRTQVPTGYDITLPVGAVRSVNVTAGQITSNQNFGLFQRQTPAPSLLSLAFAFDAGGGLTRFNDALVFDVGTLPLDTLVRVYVDGELYSQSTPLSPTQVLADGNAIPDGAHLINLTATAPGEIESPLSNALAITVDTTAPAPTINPLTTADTTPALSGSVNLDAQTVTVTVAGQTLAATLDGAGGWTLADNQLATLAAGTYDVLVTATDLAGNIGSDTTTNELIISTNTGSLTGIVFNDANRNGLMNGGESGVAGIAVYLDTNNNAQVDLGETVAITDTAGQYVFGGLASGPYIVRQVVSAGFEQTTPSFSGTGSTRTADPDAAPAATLLNTFYPGVTLSTQGTQATSPNVLSSTSSRSSTGTRVFGHASGNTWRGNRQALRATFTVPASSVTLDFIGDTHTSRNAELRAFDANGNLVDSKISTVAAGRGVTVKLTVTGSSIAFVEAYWDRIGDAQRGYFDNLVYTTVAAQLDDAHRVNLAHNQTLTGLSFGLYETPEPVNPGLLFTAGTFVDTAATTPLLWQRGYYQDFSIGGPSELPFGVNLPGSYSPTDNVDVPLVIFLHGAGSRVNWTSSAAQPDDRNHALLNTPLRLQTARFFGANSQNNPADFGAFILAPVMPAVSGQWVDVAFDAGPYNQSASTTSVYMELLENLIDYVTNPTHSDDVLATLGIDVADIDMSRIYLVGQSMGGYGAWDLSARRPDLFAGSIAVAGSGPKNAVAALEQVPRWVIHGKSDTTVPNALPSSGDTDGKGSLGILSAMRSTSLTGVYLDNPLSLSNDPDDDQGLIYSEFNASYDHAEVSLNWTTYALGQSSVNWLFSQVNV